MLKRILRPDIVFARTRPIPAALILATTLGLTACDQPAAETQNGGDKPQEVGVVTVRSQAVELFTELNGRTTPYRVAEVRPQVSGVIQKRLFEEGSRVKAGQILYRIDAKPYAAVVESAKADLAKAQAAVRVEELRAERLKKLLDQEAISQQAYDDAASNLDQARAEVALARAALKTARINLDYTTVKSPIDGRTGRSFITEGALVTANQSDELAQVTQLDPIYVDIARSSDELLRLKQAFREGKLKQTGEQQAQVRLQLEDGSEYPMSGQLQFSDITVNETTATVTLRALFPNPDHDLLPGMFVRARLSEGIKNNALLVPQQGVTHNRQGEATALIVNSEGKVELRRLTKNRAIGNDWLIEDGLDDGDQVIVNRLQNVQPGDTAVAVPAETEEQRPAENG